jgi:hypothetical protein
MTMEIWLMNRVLHSELLTDGCAIVDVIIRLTFRGLETKWGQKWKLGCIQYRRLALASTHIGNWNGVLGLIEGVGL